MACIRLGARLKSWKRVLPSCGSTTKSSSFQLSTGFGLRSRRGVAARLGVPAFFGGGFGGLFAFLGLFNGARGAGLVVGARGAVCGRFSVGFSPVGRYLSR